MIGEKVVGQILDWSVSWNC